MRKDQRWWTCLRYCMIGRSDPSCYRIQTNGRDAIMALSADIRRVVTTVDKNDKAVVLIDGPTPHKKVRPHSQTVSRLLWVTDQAPADLSGTNDRAAIEIGIMPPK